MIRLCACPEPQASGAHYPDDMHRHPGCIVFHAGVVCHMPEQQPSLDFSGTERNATPVGAGAAKGERNGEAEG